MGEGGGGGKAYQNRAGPGQASALTRQELEVLRLIADGYLDQEIADTLSVSRRTVTTYVTNPQQGQPRLPRSRRHVRRPSRPGVISII